MEPKLSKCTSTVKEITMIKVNFFAALGIPAGIVGLILLASDVSHRQDLMDFMWTLIAIGVIAVVIRILFTWSSRVQQDIRHVHMPKELDRKAFAYLPKVHKGGR